MSNAVWVAHLNCRHEFRTVGTKVHHDDVVPCLQCRHNRYAYSVVTEVYCNGRRVRRPREKQYVSSDDNTRRVGGVRSAAR